MQDNEPSDDVPSLLHRFKLLIPNDKLVLQLCPTIYTYDVHKPNNPSELLFVRETAEAIAAQQPAKIQENIPQAPFNLPSLLLLPNEQGLNQLLKRLGFTVEDNIDMSDTKLECSFEGCNIDESPQYACSGCLGAIYHGRDCQEAHSVDHKNDCYDTHTEYCEGKKGCLNPCAHDNSPMQELLHLLEEAEKTKMPVDEDAYTEATAKAARAQVDREKPLLFPIDPVTEALSNTELYLRQYMNLGKDVALPDELEDEEMQKAVLENFIMIALSKKEKLEEGGHLQRKHCQYCKLGESSRKFNAAIYHSYYICTLCQLESSTFVKGSSRNSEEKVKSRCNLAAFFRIASTCVYCKRELHCQTVSRKGRASCDAMQPSAYSTFMNTKDAHSRGGLVPCCYDCNHLKNILPFRFFVLLSNKLGPKWREWAFANAPPPADVLDDVSTSNNDAQMRWLKAEVLGALMTRHINEERQEALAAAAAAVAPAAAVVAFPEALTEKDKENLLLLGQHGIQLPVDSSSSSISAALKSMNDKNVPFTNLFNAIRGRRNKIGLVNEMNNRFKLIDFLQKKGFWGDFSRIRQKLNGTSSFRILDGEIDAIREGIALFSVDLSLDFSGRGRSLILERPVNSCSCWGERIYAKIRNECIVCNNDKGVVGNLMLRLGGISNIGGKCCYACQIHFDDFVSLGFPSSSNPKIQAAYFSVDARSQFYDHLPSNIDFCCTLCNFLKRKVLSVKAMLHLDSQLERNLAGFWKGIHNVSYDDDDDDAFPKKVDLSNLVTGALGIAFPSIVFTDSYKPDERNISKKDWDSAVKKSNEIKKKFKEGGEVWNNVDKAYDIAMKMFEKAVEEH